MQLPFSPGRRAGAHEVDVLEHRRSCRAAIPWGARYRELARRRGRGRLLRAGHREVGLRQ
eukprot:2679413-Alexandrium_andersonii.AAC.1